MNLKEHRTQEKHEKQRKKSLRMAKRTSPITAEQYLEQGHIYSEQFKDEQALAAYNKALEIDQNYAPAYNNRGNLYRRKGKYDLALVDVNKAISLRPDLAEPYVNRGHLYYEQQKWRLAFIDYNRALELKPKLDETHGLTRLIKGILFQLELEKKYFAEREEAKRFKDRSLLATAVAHEINQPVGIIRASTSAALADIQENLFRQEEIIPLLQKIHKQTERLKNIIDSFRAFARGDRSRRERVDLNQLVRQTVEIFEAQLKQHGIELDVRLSQEIPMAWANPFEIEEVLVNLLTNARHALEGREQAKVWIRTNSLGNGETEIQVEDNGPGVAPEFMEKLFMPFESTKPTEQGTGIGLHLSRKIMETFGGKLTYAPQEGGGACFTLSFPAIKEEKNNE